MRPVPDTPLQLLRLIRWPNLLIVVLSQYMAAYWLIPDMTAGRLAHHTPMLLTSLSTLLVAAAGYIINDYYDIKIDYINKPDRVVVGRYLPRRITLALHLLLTLAGIATGLMVSPAIGIVAATAAFLLWLYSIRLKKLPLWGNLTVALLTGTTVWLVYMLFGRSFLLITAYSLFAFFMSLIREIIKDMEDLEGDRQFDCRTLPVVWGMRKTKQFVYLITGLFIALMAGLVWQDGRFVWVMSGLLAVMAGLVFLLHKADKTRDFSRLSNLSKIFMLLGMISMIFFKNPTA